MSSNRIVQTNIFDFFSSSGIVIMNNCSVMNLASNICKSYNIQAIPNGHAYKVITASNICKYTKNEKHNIKATVLKHISVRDEQMRTSHDNQSNSVKTTDILCVLKLIRAVWQTLYATDGKNTLIVIFRFGARKECQSKCRYLNYYMSVASFIFFCVYQLDAIVIMQIECILV